MKQLFFLLTIVTMSMVVVAQGNGKGHGHNKNKGKSHGKEKDKEYKDEKEKHKEYNNEKEDDKEFRNEKEKDKKDKDGDESEIAFPNQHVHHGNNARHRPKKVTAALLRDYPAANNVSWSKYRGDYKATFNNGVLRSTAVYHANGERRDTRTTLTRAQLPGTIWEKIFKRDRITPTRYIQIERPTFAEKIFKVFSANNTAHFYDQNGNIISYSY